MFMNWREEGLLPQSPEVKFYTEEDLVLSDERKRPGGVPGFVTALRASATAQERTELVRSALFASGFEWLAYATVSQCGDVVNVRTLFTSYLPAGWPQRYMDEHYYEIDPRQNEGSYSGLPLVWDMHDLSNCISTRSTNPRGSRFLKELDAAEIRSGVFFSPASYTRAGERPIISLSSRRAERAWIDDAVLGQALTLGLQMHEFLSRHVQVRERGSGKRHGLSALQREILDALIRGQSDKEIAYWLDLSPHTVDYHMRQLRRRFGVHNRVQLINAATESDASSSGSRGPDRRRAAAAPTVL